MEQDNGKSFNCAESVMIAADRSVQSGHFNPSALRIASLFGGGIAGTGEICGAVTGALMYIGLALGTDGSEPPTAFDSIRKRNRELGQSFIEEFIENWGSQRCSLLVAMDKGELPAKGSLRQQDSEIKKRCEEYVEWSIAKVLELLLERELVI